MVQSFADNDLKYYMRCLAAFCDNRFVGYYYKMFEYGSVFTNTSELGKRAKTMGMGDTNVELLDNARWLMEEGHRSVYERIRAELSPLPPRNRPVFIKNSRVNDLERAQMTYVEQRMDILPQAGIAAYDWGCAIFSCLVEMKINSGHEQACWEIMLECAQSLQNSYSDWLEYAHAFLYGAGFALIGNPSKKEFGLLHNRILTLLGPSSDIGTQVDWSMDLEKYKIAVSQQSDE